MKRLILSLSLLIALTGCGTFRKHHEKDEHKQTVTIDSAAMTTKKVVEKVDTTVKISGGKSNGAKPVDNIVKGDSLVIEDNTQRVVVDYDPLTGNIRAKAVVYDRDVPVQMDRVTETTDQVELHRNAEQETKHEITEKKNEVGADGFAWGAITSFLIVFLLMAVGLYLYFRFVR